MNSSTNNKFPNLLLYSGVALNILGVYKFLENNDDKIMPFSLMTMSVIYMGAGLLLKTRPQNFPVAIVINPTVAVVDNPNSTRFANAPTALTLGSPRV